MRRLASVVIAAAAAGLVPATVLATPPVGTCPAPASRYELVDRGGWWANTVTGFAEAGIAVYSSPGIYSAEFEQFAVDFGFESAAALEAYVLGEQFEQLDKNGNGLVCMKDLPNTPGSPGYLFQPTDDNASAQR